ncbi:hypothetical protein [Bradyrhizobium lablabi]|uniref:Uncharacterized protein n=1 Tax=Bradyrhizobium lablabi TaxID=722472 RepID=A0A1H5JGK1_9BRAD|nr:hypothetical protein [Bradyrhizobium lablabi]SEE51693.1 hypothetical protein SAMN05444171_7818 [Bradyrhizobium lablabi]SEE53212.1 hypothetical protein SAMN05444171_7885 [Bradyrhizobium lablabi]
MIVLAIVATICAVLTSLIVLYANSMSPTGYEFIGVGYIWLAWIAAAVFWLAWWFK